MNLYYSIFVAKNQTLQQDSRLKNKINKYFQKTLIFYYLCVIICDKFYFKGD